MDLDLINLTDTCAHPYTHVESLLCSNARIRQMTSSETLWVGGGGTKMAAAFVLCVCCNACVCLCVRACMCEFKDLHQQCFYECDSESAGQLIDTDSDSFVFQRWLWGPAPFSRQILPLLLTLPPPCPPPTPMSCTPTPTSYSPLFTSCPSFNQSWPLTCWLKRLGVVTWCHLCLWPEIEIELLVTVCAQKKKKLVEKSRTVTTTKTEIVTHFTVEASLATSGNICSFHNLFTCYFSKKIVTKASCLKYLTNQVEKWDILLSWQWSWIRLIA